MRELSEKFIKRIRTQFPEDYDDIIKSLDSSPIISIHLNPIKQIDKFNDNKSVIWCDLGKYLNSDKRPSFLYDPFIHAGCYYVQEASSMFFQNVIDFSKDLKVLDFCAAPGGKSTLLMSKLNKNSLLVSNELVAKRAEILRENIIKQGFTNNIVLSSNTFKMTKIENFFDIVLVDAPCSGEGMFRKDADVITKWSEGMINRCSLEQKNIISDAIKLMKNNGILIYSTCTYSNEENEDNVKWIYQNYENYLEPIEVDLPPNSGIVEIKVKINEKIVQKAYRFFPHKIEGEGMFVVFFKYIDQSKNEVNIPKRNIFNKLSKGELKEIYEFYSSSQAYELVKYEDKIFSIPQKYIKEIAFFVDKFKVLKFGTEIGTFNRKNKSFIPSHQLAMSHFYNKNINILELDYHNSILFLQRDNLQNINPKEYPKGWLLVRYKKIALGWVKNLGNRFNNYYPKEWKIRKKLTY